MNKKRELEAFHAVFGKKQVYEVIASEQPDFLVVVNEKIYLGVEVTEIYSHGTDAKLKNLNKYSLGLINGTTSMHKGDEKFIKIEEFTIQTKDGNEKGKVTGIFQEMPDFKERVMILENAIADKESKISIYLRSCKSVDLIVVDSSHLFSHDNFEVLFRGFDKIFRKDILKKSLFREIYLVTEEKDHGKVYIPLKGNIFLSDCFAYEMFLRKEATKRSSKGIVATLLASLYLSGYTTLKVSLNKNEFGIHFDPWEMHYSQKGKKIRDRTLLFDDIEAEELSDLIKEFATEVMDYAESLVAKRKQVFCTVPFSFPVKST